MIQADEACHLEAPQANREGQAWGKLFLKLSYLRQALREAEGTNVSNKDEGDCSYLGIQKQGQVGAKGAVGGWEMSASRGANRRARQSGGTRGCLLWIHDRT